MKKLQFLLILLVVGALFVPAVSAELLEDHSDVTTSYSTGASSSTADQVKSFTLYRVQDYPSLKLLYARCGVYSTYYNQLNAKPSEYVPITLKIGSTIVGHGFVGHNALYDSAGQPSKVQIWVDITDWNTGALTGKKRVDMYRDDGGVLFNSVSLLSMTNHEVDDTTPIMFCLNPPRTAQYTGGYYIVRTSYDWRNEIIIDDTHVTLLRNLDDRLYGSTLIVKFDDQSVTDVSFTDTNIRYLGAGNWTVITPQGKTFFGILDGGAVPGEDPIPDNPVLRTGSVSLTDNNGTTITGFEVTAVNAYTDESYTVATDTDVAVMTLPMERTITIRNPQTGEYEEASVGYYRFYGQAPGYKMLNEDGIQVAVMPEKYSTYKLCDIGVTSESGYLTGNHQFQIRSRSDNTVLQTGTISAKSATTGDWYNTTVSGGLATLILPYDTSNLQSQYAGNYYVYATSPGYEDSDYGTQIVVMPHTVSETKIILLTPIGGIPTPGNVTLRIQAFSETGPGVVNASIFVAGVSGEGSSVWDTYTASSTGYLTVSVPGNSTYDIVASGAGYYDSARRVEVFTEDPPLIEIKLYLSGAPTLEPTTQPTGWPTDQPTTQPPGGIPDEDDDSEGFLMQAVRGIGLAFGVGFSTAKLIFGMLLALSIGYATAKQLRGGAAEFGVGLLGGTLLGVLIGLLPVWIIVVLLLVVGLYIGNRYVGGGANNG